MEDRLSRAVELEALFRRILREQELLRSALPESARQEVQPWLEEYGRWAEIGLQALRVTEAVAQAVLAPLLEEPDPASSRARLASVGQERERLRALLAESLTFRTRVMGDDVRNLAVRVLQTSGPYTG